MLVSLAPLAPGVSLSATIGQRVGSAGIDFGVQMGLGKGSFLDRIGNVNLSSIGTSALFGKPTLGNLLNNGVFSNSFQLNGNLEFKTNFTGDVSNAEVLRNTAIEVGFGSLGDFASSKLVEMGKGQVNFAKYLLNHDTYKGTIQQNKAIGISYIVGEGMQKSSKVIGIGTEILEQKSTK